MRSPSTRCPATPSSTASRSASWRSRSLLRAELVEGGQTATGTGPSYRKRRCAYGEPHALVERPLRPHPVGEGGSEAVARPRGVDDLDAWGGETLLGAVPDEQAAFCAEGHDDGAGARP